MLFLLIKSGEPRVVGSMCAKLKFSDFIKENS